MRRAEEDKASCARESVSISMLLLECQYYGLDGVSKHESRKRIGHLTCLITIPPKL